MGYVVDLRRAAYGWGKEIPAEDREYTLPGHGTAVGTIAEIDAYLARMGYDLVSYRMHDKDGVTWLKDRDLKKLREEKGLEVDLLRD